MATLKRVPLPVARNAKPVPSETLSEWRELVTLHADGFERAVSLAKPYGYDRLTLPDKLLDANVEKCPCCSTWVDSAELVDPDDGVEMDGHCGNCRKAEAAPVPRRTSP